MTYPDGQRINAQGECAMFTSIRIENFRSFPTLELLDLRSVNLVTGMNGAGKSALLEAVFLNAQAGNPGSALQVNAVRGEVASDFQNDRQFRTLFNDEGNTSHIQIDALWKSRKADTTVSKRDLSIKAIREVWKLPQANSTGLPGITGLEFDFKGAGAISTLRAKWTEMVLPAQLQQPGSHPSGPSTQYVMMTDPINATTSIRTMFLVPAPREAAAFLYQNLTNATREKNVEGIVDLAKIVDKRLTNLVPLVESGQGLVYVDVGLKRLLPLTVMGGGFSNILQIAIGIVQTKSQIIIIDEIEDGLHYTILPQLTTAIIRFASTRDIQFFISTHSAEFLDAFVASANELQFEDVCSFRIADRAGQKIATRFDARDLGNAKDVELDVR